MNTDTREKFFNALLRRPSTAKQARGILERQRVSDEDAERLIREAEDLGLIDDEAFAKLFVDGHLSWGNLKIAHELSVRGVSREAISTALDEAQDEAERASELVGSWRKGGIEDRKIISRLMSRGFTNKSVFSAAK
ncbi:MAG: RecX family transcriptional regulator [Synergistaceae bacterium]|nr:RecX family transcriptional regulator [Synergistaceae bacterium]